MANDDIKKVSSQVMELKDLISAPLVATIDADSISSSRYLDYLLELAFESYDKETKELGKLRMLTFAYASFDIGGKHVQRISIPLLTLVPLPLLQVKEADFEFDIQIIDAVSESYDKQFSFKNEQVQDGLPPRSQGIKLRAALAPDVGQQATKGELRQGLTANMKVKVKMQQADVPGGVANLLHLTTNNLQIEDVESDDSDKNKVKRK